MEMKKKDVNTFLVAQSKLYKEKLKECSMCSLFLAQQYAFYIMCIKELRETLRSYKFTKACENEKRRNQDILKE